MGVPLALVVLVVAVASGTGLSRPRSHPGLGSDSPGPPLTEGWTQVLFDGFNFLDASHWNVANSISRDNEESNLWAGNVNTSGGILRFQGKKQTTTNSSGTTRQYTSGYLDSHGKITLPDYFRVQIRAKLPFEQGMWPAPVWFRPEDNSGGEIDLVEAYGVNRSWPKVYQRVHTDYGPDHQQLESSLYLSSLGDEAGTAWHTYTVEKTPGRIDMWIDQTKSASFSSATASWFDQYYEAGKTWEIRMNMQIGSNEASSDNHPDDTTDWTALSKTALLVDYVEAWVPSDKSR